MVHDEDPRLGDTEPVATAGLANALTDSTSAVGHDMYVKAGISSLFALMLGEAIIFRDLISVPQQQYPSFGATTSLSQTEPWGTPCIVLIVEATAALSFNRTTHNLQTAFGVTP